MPAATAQADLATTFPALDPEVSAAVTDSLLAAVSAPADADPADRFGLETTLIGELDAFHARDLEETILAAQALAANHAAMACFQAATRLDPASKEASRLRRDAIALQCALTGMVRALHKSQARPVAHDARVPRPTVPIAQPRPAARSAPPPAPRQDHAKQVDAPDTAAPAPAPVAVTPQKRRSPFEGRPDLQRLNAQWHTLPHWENMTMQQRIETWGYVHPPESRNEPRPDTPEPPPEA